MNSSVKVVVNADGKIFKTFKAKSTNETVFAVPLLKDDYWKLQYDVNRATHSVERKSQAFSITVKTFDNAVDADGNPIVVKSEDFTTRQDFYNEIRKLLAGAKAKSTTVTTEIAQTADPVPAPVPPVVASVIDISNKTRKELIEMAKAIGLKNYSDMNMKQIAEKIAEKQVA